MGVGICTGDEGDTKMLTKVKEEVVDDILQLAACPPSCCLVPITPDVDREQGGSPVDANSPLTLVVRKPPICNASDSNDHNASSPQTPKHGVFDPFAPGPEDMAQAPMCRKYLKQLRTIVVRRLHFGSSDRISELSGSSAGDAECFSEEEIFENICQNLLELIVSKQIEGGLAETHCKECDSDVCKTPSEALFNNGIADSCPAAPFKREGKPTVHIGRIDDWPPSMLSLDFNNCLLF